MHKVVDWFLHKKISSEVLASVLKATRDLERDFSKKDSREFCQCNLPWGEPWPARGTGDVRQPAAWAGRGGESPALPRPRHYCTVQPDSGFWKYLQGSDQLWQFTESEPCIYRTRVSIIRQTFTHHWEACHERIQGYESVSERLVLVSGGFLWSHQDI